ncbi:cytochrome b [Pelagovum pacificum]|uniref:Cytochrome b n=1 Tax=Pelagovum pacificum TaxID=2588711 RepID=A0A5C5GIZ2_9RHOB|nr:cytochrome b/b6 domain-containing protein [Pelagovum pacificum]QQA43014.1 cytochrome b [Pelagovum pacificum]TNY33841.1 cytochrome b [Pelagovum pacificum]
MAKVSGYSRQQIALHWAVVVLVGFQFVAHDGMEHAWRDGTTGLGAIAHVAVGLTVLVLMLVRLAIRLRRGAPPPPESDKSIFRIAADVTHWAFYALLMLIPLSGALAWFGGLEAPAEGHEVMGNLLLAVIALHAFAAVFHKHITGTRVLDRMVYPSD